MRTGVSLTCLLLALLCKPAGATQEPQGATFSNLGLTDGVDAALIRNDPEAVTGSRYHASRWLAALPTLSLTYLDSRANRGTDETEITLNLPLKSPARLRADARLRETDKSLATLRESYRRLFVSGLVREAWWSYRIASLQHEGALNRMNLLEQLVARQRKLVDSSALPAYALLIAQRELLAAKAEAASGDSEVNRWRERYREITGLPVPDKVTATDLNGSTIDKWVPEHPAVRLLELDWRRQQAVIAANTSAAESWNLGLTGKELESPGSSEQQVGLSLEVPLSFLRVASQSDSSDWSAGARNYWRARDELLADLRNRNAALHAERQALEARLTLLREAVELNKEIAEHLSALAAGNEIESELLLRRRLDVIATRLELTLAKARLAENSAMLLQAMGISL